MYMTKLSSSGYTCICTCIEAILYIIYIIFLNERDIYQNQKKHRNKIGIVPCFGNKIKYHFYIKHHFHITTVHNDCFFVFCLYSRHMYVWLLCGGGV